MVEKFKSLNGENCLGEKISVRKVGEETTRTNAQAAVIALKALNMITGQKPLVKTSDEIAEEEIQLGPQTLEVKANSLKTINTSRIIKISNIYDRDRVMTVDDYEELKDNFEAEMQNIGQLRGLKVIRNGEERLGAEVGSIFVEFKDIKGAQLGLKQVKGRIYDGFEVKCVYKANYGNGHAVNQVQSHTIIAQTIQRLCSKMCVYSTCSNYEGYST